jgi:D-alanine-D-alanine ligase
VAPYFCEKFTMSNKIRVAVLYGGRSGEHEVSLMSATNVIQYLDRSRFEVVPIGIDKQGVWFLGDDTLRKELNAPKTLELLRDSDRMLFNPDYIGRNFQAVQASQLISHVKKSERLFDVIFPVIHGTLCEDGTVQGLLELAEIPYVGCGVLASAVGMDKDVSKRLVMNAGMRVAPYVVIKRGHWDREPKRFCDLVTQQLNYPVFVKPANTGSSVGVEKIKSPEELHAAIDRAFHYDVKVLVEQGIDAREIEVAVLESLEYGADPILSIPGEIKPTHEFYSYAAKYLDEKGAELVIPAPLSEALQIQVQQFAKNIFAILECEGMARVDLFLEKNTNEIYFNEVNTIPGFTQISMYPKLMAASGVSYTELLTHLVMLAVRRHEQKSKLSRECSEIA